MPIENRTFAGWLKGHSQPLAHTAAALPGQRRALGTKHCSEPVPDPSQAALGVHGPVCEQADVCLVSGRKAVVEPGSPAEIGIDAPVRERAVEQPCVVERGIAQARVAPIDHAGEPAVAHE